MLGMLWLVVHLPYGLQLQTGAALGRLMYWLAKRKKHIAGINISLAFPDLTKQEQAKLLKANFRSNGISLIETGLAWWGNPKKLERLIHIEGLENIQQGLDKGKGVIMLGGHFTTLIICGRLLALKMPFHIVIKKAHNELFEALMNHYRSQQYQGIIDTTELRQMLKALKSNHVVWYAPDQDFGPKREGVFAPFMGIQTKTITSTSRLASKTGAAVVYIDFERLPGSQGYKFKLHPPLPDYPSGDDTIDAEQLNTLIENHVREVPDQYLWIHRRFKTRPKGELGFYGYADTRGNIRKAEAAKSGKQPDQKES